MFEKASRLKLRVDSSKGSLAVEDLWDLPLTSTAGKANLDAMAVALFVKVKETNEVSFVTPKEDTSSLDRLRFDIVKHILDVKLAERDAAKIAADNREKKRQLQEIIHGKENQALQDMPLADLRKMIDSL